MTPTRRADLLARFEHAGRIATQEYESRNGVGEPNEAELAALEVQDAIEHELALDYLTSRHG